LEAAWASVDGARARVEARVHGRHSSSAGAVTPTSASTTGARIDREATVMKLDRRHDAGTPKNKQRKQPGRAHRGSVAHRFPPQPCGDEQKRGTNYRAKAFTRFMTPLRLASWFFVLLAIGCGAAPMTATEATPEPESPITAAPAPTLAITLEPSTIAVGDQLVVTLTTTNFTFSAPGTGGNGHFHYYFDDASDQYSASYVPKVTLQPSATSALGAHRITAYLVNSSHQAIKPLVKAQATFTLH
jgi:hypothetical protein